MFGLPKITNRLDKYSSKHDANSSKRGGGFEPRRDRVEIDARSTWAARRDRFDLDLEPLELDADRAPVEAASRSPRSTSRIAARRVEIAAASIHLEPLEID